MTTADPAQQRRLLDLQALDTRLDQLAHRRRTLPEAAAAADLEQRVAAARDAVVAARTAEGDVTREVAKAEADVELVRQRAARTQARLDAGQGSGKELEAMQHELGSLAKRQSDLEDVELEVMERLEAAQEQHAAARAEVERLEVELASTAGARDEALGGIDAEAGDVRSRRDALAGELDGQLLALYERVRDQLGGTGAAALKGKRCEGCRLELNPTDLQRIRAAAPEEVVRCEECGRVLVREPQPQQPAE